MPCRLSCVTLALICSDFTSRLFQCKKSSDQEIKMAGKLQVLSLFASLFLYILDLGTDVYVAIQHKENGDISYYRLTVGFIVLSIIVVNFFATFALGAFKVHWSLRALAFLHNFP